MTTSHVQVNPDGWDEWVSQPDGLQLVLGGPGTGKTEFLVRRALHLLDDRQLPPARLLVLSFGRRGVADLRDRIRGRLVRSVAELDVSTFHSFASRLLEKHSDRLGWESAPQILTGPEQAALVRELLEAEDPTAWSPAFRTALGTATFAAEVTDFLLRSSEQMLSDRRLESLAGERDDWRGLPEFAARYRQELRRIHRIDYGLVLAEATALLGGADPPDTPAPHYVLVDEYQDTSASQVLLLEALVARGAALTVAADPLQSIYSFRGATAANVEEFAARFDEDGTTTLRLTTSFRVPKTILESAERIVAESDRWPTTRPAPATGRVDVHVFDQQSEEAEWVAGEISRLHLAQRLQLDRIGVLVRSKRRFLPELSRALDRHGIAHDTPESRLSDHPAVRFVLDAVLATTDSEGPAETERAVRRLLLGPQFALPLARLRDVERLRRKSDVGWADAIQQSVPGSRRFADLLRDPTWAVSLPAVEGFWALWSELPRLDDLVTNPARVADRAAWASFAQVLSRWNERNPASTLEDYRRLTEGEEFEARPLLSYRPPAERQVALTTLHQAKGLEFDVVFICDAVEGVFPDLRTRDSLLGVRHLLPHIPTSTTEYLAFRLAEERRLAYTAMSRARSRVVWTATSTGFEEGRGIPSRFLARVAGTATVAEAATTPDRHETPVTIVEAEAQLRRIAGDPAESAPARLAAVATLAAGSRWGMRDVEHFDGVRARGADTGLVPPQISLSPSQAELYEQCPRRYALERRLRIGDQRSVYADFGILIHDVLQTVEQRAVDTGRERSTLDEALDQLDAVFPDGAFGGGEYARAWRNRGRGLLENLYEKWPSPGRAIALEHRLELDVGGRRWVGRADRIEVMDGTTRVVDYKTSKTPTSKEDANGSIQLGFYVMAADADPLLAEAGPCAGAEMWYPAARSVRNLTTRSFDMTLLDTVRERMEAVGAGIAAEDFPATPGDHCDRCSVRLVCPAWPEGGTEFAS